MSQNTHFVKGEIFQKEEGKCVEFKREIDSSKNIVNGIVDYAEKYVICFLNAIIEDLDPIVVKKLEQQADRHGRSLQAELKEILLLAVVLNK